MVSGASSSTCGFQDRLRDPEIDLGTTQCQSAGAVEGLNNKLKLTIRKAYGYRSVKVIEIALYRALGHLPQPDFAHKFS